MKFLHLGDLHIGKQVNDFSMIDDQIHMLHNIIELIEQEKIDAVLIAGDIYDRTIPSEEAVKVFDDFICRLAAKQIPAYIISGNHDSDERLNFGSSLFEKSEIHIVSKFQGALKSITIQDAHGPIHIYMLPYVKASQVKRYYPDAKIHSYDDAFRTIFENSAIDQRERNILIAHQFVAGNHEEPVISGSEYQGILHVGDIEKVSTDCLKQFDYVALGHIHSPQKIGADHIRYAGSLLKYSLKEIYHKKTAAIITMEEKGRIQIEEYPLIPKRDVRQIKGKMAELLKPEYVSEQDDYIAVVLTDEEPIENAIGIIRQTYPNVMSLVYDNKHTKGRELAEYGELQETRSLEEIFEAFYENMYGCEMDADEKKMLMEAAREAGIIHETD